MKTLFSTLIKEQTIYRCVAYLQSSIYPFMINDLNGHFFVNKCELYIQHSYVQDFSYFDLLLIQYRIEQSVNRGR